MAAGCSVAAPFADNLCGPMDRFTTAVRRGTLAALTALVVALAAPAVAAEGELRATFDPASRALTVLWKAGPEISEVRLIVPPRLAERLHAVEFPDGWYVAREAGSLTLRGPATPPPVRFRLEAAEGAMPRAIAVEVRSADHPVFATDALPIAAAARPASSLTGLVRLPPVVSPGERVLLHVLDPKRTPMAGSWRVGGAAAAPYDPQISAFDPARARRVVLELSPAASGPETAPARDELARLAAALAAEDRGARPARYQVRPVTAAELDPGAAIEEEEFAVEELPVEEPEKPPAQGTEAVEEPGAPEPPAEEEVPAPPGETDARRGLEHAIAYAAVPVEAADFGLADEPGAAVFAVTRGEGRELLADVGPGDEGVRLYLVGGGPQAGGAPDRVFAVAATGEESQEPPRFLAVVPARGEAQGLAFEVAPVEKLPPPSPPELIATLLTADLPADLAPGGPLAVTYTDATGEITVDVPAAAGVVVEPPGRRDGPPRLDDAAAYALPGATLCVCGRFPSPRAWRGLTLDGAPVMPTAASGWAAWLPLPPDLLPGPHTIGGLPALGFPPGHELDFAAIAVTLRIDESRLLGGEPAPLTLRVTGTEEPLAINVRNRTPERATLENGDLQTVTTSGGMENAATLTLRPRRRGGAPDISWELIPPPCPCAQE
jgi:hypothetical protein